MRVRFLQKIALAAGVSLAMAFTGCASVKVIDKNIPEPERATLYLAGSERVLDKVDGKSVGTFGIFAGPKGTATNKEDGKLLKQKLKPTAQIPPGTRKITLSVPSTMGFGGKEEATYDFAPGKKYRVAYEEPGVQDGETVKSLKDVKNALTRVIVITEITGEIPEE